MPEKTNALGHSNAVQIALGTQVLRSAFTALCEQGWCPPVGMADLGNRPEPLGLGIGDALWIGAPDTTVGAVWVEYARRLLRRVEYDFLKWEQHPLRSRLDMLRLIQAAVAAAGEEPPEMPKRMRPKRRGGWRVSTRQDRAQVCAEVYQ